jgi:hypothetical protein
MGKRWKCADNFGLEHRDALIAYSRWGIAPDYQEIGCATHRPMPCNRVVSSSKNEEPSCCRIPVKLKDAVQFVSVGLRSREEDRLEAHTQLADLPRETCEVREGFGKT